MADATLHGVTAQTPKHLVIDAGVIVRNFVPATPMPALSTLDVIGATNGGVKIDIVETIFTPKIDGVRGPGIGERITDYDVKVSGNLAEVPRDVITDMLPGSSFATYSTTHWKVSPGEIASADYLTNVAVLITHSSNTALPVGAVVVIENARGNGKFSIDTKNGDNANLPFEYVGCVTASAPQDAPWTIYLPKVSGDAS